MGPKRLRDGPLRASSSRSNTPTASMWTPGGALSSNGIYYSDSTGKVILSEITGTVVVTELESVEG